MLISCRYTEKDVLERPYLLTAHYIRLYGQSGELLPRIETFDTETKLGTRKDGSTVKVARYGWRYATPQEKARLLNLLPEDQHHLVQQIDLEDVTSER